MTLFTGNANPVLAQKVAEHLKISLGEALVTQFSDGETRVEILENIRGQDVFILQSTSAPTNNHLMELLLIADAVRRASADRIVAVVPYYGYARQDRRNRSARVPITAKIVADLFNTVGIDKLLTVDLHSEQIQGFFSIPVDNVYGSKVLLEDIIKQGYPNPMVVSPDVGGVVRARAFAKRLNHAELAIIDKRRPHPNESHVMNVIGDVKNRHCVIVDDMIDTAGTVCLAAEALKKAGATKIVAYCTHPVLSQQSVENLMASPLDELVVTDTIPLNEKAKLCPKIRQLGIAGMLSEAIYRVSKEESISSMFN